MIENWNVYQEGTRLTAIYPGTQTKLGLLYVCLGLLGETGEVAEHGKKCLRDDGGILTAERREQVGKELGDVAWYAAGIAHEARFKLEGVRILNPAYEPESSHYVGRGTPIGFGYVVSRLAIAVGKVVEDAMYVMPYTVPDRNHWTEVGQGRTVRGRLQTGLGRVLWYAERVALEAGTNLDFVLSANLAKLADRKARGALHGAGSDR